MCVRDNAIIFLEILELFKLSSWRYEIMQLTIILFYCSLHFGLHYHTLVFSLWYLYITSYIIYCKIEGHINKSLLVAWSLLHMTEKCRVLLKKHNQECFDLIIYLYGSPNSFIKYIHIKVRVSDYKHNKFLSWN